MSNILEVQHIHTFIGQYHILQGVDVTVPQGSITALLGRNGAGKTTTLKSILGLAAVRQGKVIFDGLEVQGMQPYDIAALGIGFVPEHRAIFRDLSVEENLKIAERNKGDYLRKQDFIFDLFPDLKRFLGIPGTRLSGGQQQMLAIGRGLMSRPKLMMLDEPSFGLAPILVEQIFGMITAINRQGVTVLLVEQNVRAALELTERAYVIENGRVVGEGSGDALLTFESIRTAYLA